MTSDRSKRSRDSKKSGRKAPTHFSEARTRELESWIRLARDGSGDHLGRLINACRRYLLFVANQSLSAALQAKVGASDLVQDTALEAHRDFKSFDGERLEELLGWMRRILLHNAANISRHYQRTKKRKLKKEHSLTRKRAQIADVKSRSRTPYEQLASLEESQLLEKCLKALKPEMQTVILLRHREHLSFADIAKQMQRTAAAAQKLWARAIERLREEMTKLDH